MSLKIIKYRTKLYFKSAPDKAFINVHPTFWAAKQFAELYSEKSTVLFVEIEEC